MLHMNYCTVYIGSNTLQFSLLLSCRAFDYDTQCVLYILVDMNNINIDYVCVTHTNMLSDTHIINVYIRVCVCVCVCVCADWRSSCSGL